MGLLSNRLDRESLKPGDHIYSWRAAYIYAHHGIYLGDDRVVHFTRLGQEVGTGTGLDVLIIGSMPPPSLVTCPSCNHTDISNGVISSCLECFLNGGLLYRFEYSVNPAIFLARPRGGTCTLAASDPPETVINRANHLVKNGFGCYNILKNNCIHFAIYCKTGLLHVSDKRTMSPSGLAASVIVRPVHAIFSSTLKVVKVASSVAACRVSRYDDGIGKKGDAVKFKKGS